MATVQTMLVEAVRLHQAGRLDQAAPLYQKVLALEPKNADALNLLGLAAVQTGQHQAGAQLIRQAIAANGRQAAYHFNLGLALQHLGELDNAAASYRRALVLNPRDVESYNNLGNVLGLSGKPEEALTAFRKALAVQEENPVVLNNMGTSLSALGRDGEAEANYRKALVLKPDYSDAMINLGNLLRARGELAAACELFRRAIALTPKSAAAHNSLGLTLWNLGQRDEALGHYQKALALEPNLVEAMANMGTALWEKGDLDQADALYRRLLGLRGNDPDLLNNFAALAMARGDGATALEVLQRSLALSETSRAKKLFVELIANASWSADNQQVRAVLARALSEPWGRPAKLARPAASLITLNPLLAPLIARAGAAWPRRLEGPDLLGGSGFAPLAEDALLMTLLTTAPNADMALERFLTMARGALLQAQADEKTVAFAAALAQQCFINEYVFLPEAREIAAAESLRQKIAAALASDGEIAALDLLSFAAYQPLHALPNAEKLGQRAWPACVEAVVTQQLREPMEEAGLKRNIPRLTPIEDAVSRLVKDQYEENPYPRWVKVAPATPANIVSFLSEKFPLAPFERQTGRVMKDVLVAGCGTGQQSILTAQKFGDRNLLAVDLSQASLAYAARKSAQLGLAIEYGQADILELAGRDFDLIESIGVLHHMKDPFEGWKSLLKRLRPHGFMWLGFYSEIARRNIVEARARIAELGLTSSPDDIRRFRQTLADNGPGEADYASILKSEDFYAISTARDLLFHAQEHRLSLPAIARFLADNKLTFLGFELDDAVTNAYHRRFPGDEAGTSLPNWDIFEHENPGLFAAMYVFWIQKNG